MGCSSGSEIEGTQEEHEFDRLQLKSDWNGIVALNSRQPAQSLACRKVVLLAQCNLGQAPASALYDCLADSREVLSSPLAAMMMSDVYIQLGMVNMAQRAAFESMAKVPDRTQCGRALRRLTECAIITGQNALAKKYTYLLEELPAHRDWARSMRRIAEHPELISEQPVYENLKRTYEETADQFFL